MRLVINSGSVFHSLFSAANYLSESSLLVHVPSGCLVSEPKGGEVQGILRVV